MRRRPVQPARLNEWAAAQLDLQPKDDVLDVGCGPGVGLAFCLARTEGRVVGLDHAPRMIQQALRKHIAAVRYDQLDLRCEPLRLAAFEPGERFDKILAVNVLQHLDDGANSGADAVRVLRYVLQPGGKIVIVLPHDAAGHEGGRQQATWRQVPLWLRGAFFSDIRHLRFGPGSCTPHAFIATAAPPKSFERRGRSRI